MSDVKTKAVVGLNQRPPVVITNAVELIIPGSPYPVDATDSIHSEDDVYNLLNFGLDEETVGILVENFSLLGDVVDFVVEKGLLGIVDLKMKGIAVGRGRKIVDAVNAYVNAGNSELQEE